jgi:lysozyme family protein
MNMDRNFARSLTLVLAHEGGYVNHPKDPGGATNLGITLATFRRFIKPSGTVEDLKRLTKEQAGTCYRRQYWNAIQGSELPGGVDYAVFDFAVNSGPSRAAKYLQAIVGAKVDGVIGPATIAATKAMMRATVVNELCDRRMAFLKRLKTWGTFGRGWTSRVSSVRAEALKMAALPDKEPPVVIEKTVHVPIDQPVVPATVEKAVKKQTNGWGWSGVGAGGIGAAITAATGLDWKVIAIFAGIGVVGAIVALVIGPQIVRRVKAIRAEVAG